jgi:hypothetical protein
MPFERGPYLSVAAFCEQVIEDKSGVLSLIRIVDRMNVTAQGPSAPPEMPPSNLNWTLVLTLKSGEARGSHEVKIVPELPSGETIPPSIFSVHLEGGNRGANLISRINMLLTMPGVYWFKIYIDDEFITQLPIEVIYSRFVSSTG